MLRRTALFALAAALVGHAPVALAQDEGRLVVVQQRKYRLAHELVVRGVFEPQDAFTKGLGAEAGYVWHLDDAWSWEVLRAGYLAPLDTSLRTQLERDFGVSPTAFETLRMYAASSLAYEPLYGKLALRNASLVHVAAFVKLGVAVGKFTTSAAAGPELGVGLRVFLSKRLSVRIEASDAYFLSRKPANVVFLGAGLAISLGGTDN